MEKGNFSENLPDAAGGEIAEVLARFGARSVRVERIVSGGHPTPPGEWYDQDGDEWVVLLCGTARLVFENSESAGTVDTHETHGKMTLSDIELSARDWLRIPAHRRHRVAEVSRDAVWLAVHAESAGASENPGGGGRG